MSIITRLGAALHRLVHPQHAAERAQIERLTHAVESLVSKQRDQAADLQAAVQRAVRDLAGELTRRDRAVQHGLSQIEASLGRQYHIGVRALRAAGWNEELRVVERRVKKRLARMSTTDVPVVIGPWTGEVGFELLYWIPFVTWALRRAGVAPQRVIVISRGGAAPWYRHLAPKYFDAFTFFSIDEFRAETEAAKKQKAVRAFDRRIIRRVLAQAGIRRACLLHPGLMYPLFRPFWKQQATVRRLENYTDHRLLDAGGLPDPGASLPRDFVAVRFYFSACFPDTPANRAFVDTVIGSLSRTTDVVLLNTTFSVDDHRDYGAQANHGRIHSIAHLMTPETNLAIQTAVIARARAFVGTYGGYAYLAPLYGVKSLAFYSDYDAFFAHHLDYAQRVFRRIGAASLVPLDVRDLDLLQRALGADAGGVHAVAGTERA